MAISDADVERTIRLVLPDVLATVGPGYDWIVRTNAERLRKFALDSVAYLERVLDDTQQQIHAEFIDTTWPRCPIHSRHPLWLYEGSWWCEADRVQVAAVGELGSTLRRPSR